jgi:hypothetical protein
VTSPLTLDVTLSGLAALAALDVRPSSGQGFAATIIAAFVVLGVLALVAMFVSSRPRSRRRPPGDRPR